MQIVDPFAPKAQEIVDPFAQKAEAPRIVDPFAQQPEETPENQSIFRQVADVPLKAAAGVASGVRLISDAFGAGSGVSNTIRGVEDYIANLYSAQAKNDAKEISRIMNEAEDKGVGDQVKAALKAFTVAPVDTVVNALGTSAPAIVAGLGATVLGAPAAAVGAAGAGIGALMGAGTVKGSIYDSVKGELQKTDMPPEQIEARAQAAQEYGGKNLDMILGGAALGTIGATTGFEPAAARQVAKQIMGKAVAKDAAEETAKLAERGAIKHGALTAAKEFAGEAAEGGQEQLAQNIALQREGYNVPTMRGVAGQAALEGLAGLGLGAVGGAREAKQAQQELAAQGAARPPAQPPEQPSAEQEVDARVQQRAQELEQQGYMQEDAAAIAVKNVADEDKKARGPELDTAVADVTPDPERVKELTTQFQDQFNLSQDEAHTTAVELATDEAKEDALAQTATEGATSVGQPIPETSGVSPELAGQPNQVTPTTGVGEPATNGVVPAGENVGVPDERTAEQPTALTEPTPQEGAPVGTETPEAVQAETQGQEPAPAAEVVEPTTPQQLAQEFIAEEETKAEEPAPAPVAEKPKKLTKADRKSRDDANLREVEAVAEKFNEAIKPLSPEEEEKLRSFSETKAVTGETINPEDAYDPIRDRRQAKIKAIRDILELRDRMASASPEVKARINDMLYHPEISSKEVADVKAGIALQRKYSAQLKAAEAPADTKFNKATNGAQALAIVIKTGNGFQKMLAKRILPFVRNVKFVVVEKGNEPDALKTEKGAKFWHNASGLFVQNDATNERTVYVAGDSYGELQGINNITVLHELLHAATNQKLYLGLKAIENGFSTDAALTKAVRDLQDVMHRVQDYIMDNRGQLPPAVVDILKNTNGSVITDLREFLAYGMSDPDFQEFMMQVQGVEEDVSFFSRFVTAIREFFKMGEDTTNALTDLIVATDKLLTAQKTADMRLLEAGDQALAQRTNVLKISQQTVKKTDAVTAKIEKSSFADNIRDNFPLAAALRDKNKMSDVLAVNTKNWKLNTLRQLLPSLQTETLVQWAERIQVGNERGIPGIRESWTATNDMLAMRNKLTNAMGDINQKLTETAQKSPDQYKKLADVMHFSTLISKDPATNKTNTALNRMWGELTEDNQKLYEQVRDFYKNNHELYHHLLDEQIGQSNMDPDVKGKLIAQIKKMYEDGKKLYPYFPLMRYGQFWVRVGKGKDGEFHMFESAKDRDYFVLERVRQLNESGDKRTREEMIRDSDIDEGNDLSNARRNDTSASDMLKQVFNSIDAAEKGGKVDAESLKDEIYQLYLQTLPDRNFRRQYLKRQGKAGFSGDIQRNFVNSGLNVANQLSRIKYGPKIMDQLDRAQASLEGNPDKARLGEFVSEMRIRAEQQVRPDPEVGAWFAAAKLANTSAFLWMMTSVKTMVAQFTAVPVFVAPVLGSKYGTAKTATALGKSLNVFNGLGVKDKDGNWAPPSMSNLKDLTADEKRATQYMRDRGISDTTLAFDLGGRRDIPTAVYNGKARQMTRQVSGMMTALFHHAERMIREVTFMSSYRLNREMGKTHEASLRQAEADTHESLNNYHASNRPRGLVANSERQVMLDAHKPLGRAVLQFKMFPAFVTTYFVRNAYRMTRDMDPEIRKEARKQLLGSLGMSFALAGTVGIPGISFAMGIVQGLLNALRSDDDDDELEKRNLEFWIRNKWMPETFGNVKIGSHNLAELLDRGLIAGLTGYDITSSLSMNNMWVPEMKDQASLAGEVQSVFLSMMGPGASLATTQIPKGIDYFNQGKILQGMEQWAPALFRGGLTAERYRREGATTASGAVIKDKDEFTAGQLLAQSLGFVTEGLQARREAIFQLQGEIMKVKQERTALLARLDLEMSKGTDEDVEKVFDKLIKFNSHNPMDAIDADNIRQSAQKLMKRRLMSDRGFPIDKKYYPFVVDLLEPSGVKLDREAVK